MVTVGEFVLSPGFGLFLFFFHFFLSPFPLEVNFILLLSSLGVGTAVVLYLFGVTANIILVLKSIFQDTHYWLMQVHHMPLLPGLLFILVLNRHLVDFFFH